MRIGVFVCHCGTNIKGIVDVVQVSDAIADERDVVFATHFPYLCSFSGQELILNYIREHNLTAVVVSACSPRMHEQTFRKAANRAGLNPYFLEIANIREQCSWVHTNGENATQKAIQLTRAAIAKVRRARPLFHQETPVTKRALVIGGGIAGIQCALDIAEAGYDVELVERLPSIGGRMAQLDKTFPTLDCAACILTPKMVEAFSHEKITLHTYSEIEKIEGFVGNFTVQIKNKARSIITEKCTGCGDCIHVCPVKKIPSEFECGMAMRSAIYIPFAQAVPLIPTIDRENCLFYKTGKCKICAKACKPGAINFSQEDEIIEIKCGIIVTATGYQPISLDAFCEYFYHESPNVITSLEFERMVNAAGPTEGKILCPSDKRIPKRITFIQCVGSRDTSRRGKPYCSKICCMYTAKQAILIKEKHPEIDVQVFYIDVRSGGKNYDEFYRRAVEAYGVKYIKGQVSKIVDTDGVLALQASDLLENKRYETTADMVILATAIESAHGVKGLAQLLSTSLDANGFFTEAHPKLRPVETATAGIFIAGACHGPRDIPEAVAQASAAAAKAIGVLSKDKLLSNPCIAYNNEEMCNGCAICISICPYKAINLDKPGKASVNPALCQGCGGCAAACPSGALDLSGFSHKQLMSEVDALCR
jgi:heterodisulfide reductase subunit A